MKLINKLFGLLMCSLFFISCKKNETPLTPLASLNITTAIVGGGNVKLNTNDRDSAKAYNAKAFILTAGNSAIQVYPTNNPSINYYNSTQVTVNGGAYSLFLSGQGSTYDAVFIQDNIPTYYTDSTIGVRIINLSPNSTPVNITLGSTPTTNEFTNLAYKQITAFKKYPLLSVIPAGSVTWQVRDGVSNALLASYTLPTSVNSTYPNISTVASRNRNLTIVIKGLQGTTTGTDAFGIFPVANY